MDGGVDMAYELSLGKEADMTEIRLDKMSESERNDVAKIKDGIKFDYESISTYGRDVTKKLTEFSTQVLDTVKVKDAPEIEEMLVTLVGDLNKFNTEELVEKKQGLFDRLFKTNKTNAFLMRYESISEVISQTKSKLEQAEYQLQKDIKTSEAYLEMNRGYIRELEKYILAADQKVADERKEIEEERKTLNPSDTLAVQELSVRESDLGNLERKAYNLRLQRTIAIQNIPQLMLIKDGDAILASKIDDGINQAIPLWESQILIGLQAMRQQTGAMVAKSVSDTTNRLLAHNAEVLKQSAIGVAIENERDIADLETLKNTNQALIETINGVRQVRKQGQEKREQSIKELAQIQTRLNQALIESNN